MEPTGDKTRHAAKMLALVLKYCWHGVRDEWYFPCNTPSQSLSFTRRARKYLYVKWLLARVDESVHRQYMFRGSRKFRATATLVAPDYGL